MRRKDEEGIKWFESTFSCGEMSSKLMERYIVSIIMYNHVSQPC